MDFYKTFRLQEEHYKDLLRQAEQYRLAQAAMADRPKRTSLWRRLINWMGHMLAELACVLRRQFNGQTVISFSPTRQKPCEE